MIDLKHVGRVKSTGRKCLIAYRTLPGDAHNCLIIPTENLPDANHDALIQLVESSSAQSSYEFAEVLARAKFPDGSTMLPWLHTQARLLKVPTDQIEMTPNFTASVSLSELNQIIAEQRGISVNDLAIKNTAEILKTEVVEVAKVNDISPGSKTTAVSLEESAVKTQFSGADDEARYYRSQADRLSKEAASLRRKAEDLAPTKKAK
jgi:hypothetical protein